MVAPRHKPVLLREAVAALAVRPGGKYIDATLGEGGHAAAILEACLPGGKLLGLDADPLALASARQRLAPYSDAVELVNENFINMKEIAARHGFLPAQGVLFDLGLSSLQLEDTSRGFSFLSDAPLDMRFDPRQPVTAADLVNTLSEEKLARLLEEYGEERQARRIARFIVQRRPLRTSAELARIIAEVAPQRGRIHPATRTFQALRIAVNRELENLSLALRQVPEVLGPGGRLAVISFHSLEDRLVKEFLRQESRGCLCPPELPACRCGHVPTLKVISRKVIRPSAAEQAENPRSRSSRLRVGERL